MNEAIQSAGPTRARCGWQLRSRKLVLGEKTLVMGIVNITPDSFSDGGLYLSAERAIAHALELLGQGADMIDLGAESTKPGSLAGSAEALSTAREQERMLPVLAGILKARPEAVISADTYKAATARAAVAAGAEIVNDVSGFHWDEEMAGSCAELGCGVVLMHSRGRPGEWRDLARMEGEPISLLREGLVQSLAKARAAGISEDAVVLDPGYGFGKRMEENYLLLARQAELLALGRPLLAGLSRKSFLGRVLAARLGSEGVAAVDAQSRETASIAAMTISILYGASIVRVHQVRPAVEAAAIADMVLAEL